MITTRPAAVLAEHSPTTDVAQRRQDAMEQARTRPVAVGDLVTHCFGNRTHGEIVVKVRGSGSQIVTVRTRSLFDKHILAGIETVDAMTLDTVNTVLPKILSDIELEYQRQMEAYGTIIDRDENFFYTYTRRQDGYYRLKGRDSGCLILGIAVSMPYPAI